jgi:hypothetical protein
LKDINNEIPIDVNGLKDSIIFDLMRYSDFSSFANKDSAIVMNYNISELTEIMGTPFAEDSFSVRRANRTQEGIFNFFPIDSDIKIKELNWKMDSVYYVTIWYEQKDEFLKPIVFSVREEGFEY